MLTYSFHFSQFNNLSVFSKQPKFGSIYTRNIYNKIIIEILGYFWGVTKQESDYRHLVENASQRTTFKPIYLQVALCHRLIVCSSITVAKDLNEDQAC